MSAPDRIWAIEFARGDRSWTDNPRIGKYRQDGEYLRADGPTITAYREALRTMGLCPDKIAQEAQQ